MTFKNGLNIELDSRLIYQTDEVYHSKVCWARPDINSDSEWLYCGLQNDFKKDLVTDLICKQFPDTTTLYLKHERNDSIRISRSDLISNLTDFIGKDIRVWDDRFLKVIEINRTGIVRLGTTASN